MQIKCCLFSDSGSGNHWLRGRVLMCPRKFPGSFFANQTWFQRIKTERYTPRNCGVRISLLQASLSSVKQFLLHGSSKPACCLLFVVWSRCEQTAQWEYAERRGSGALVKYREWKLIKATKVVLAASLAEPGEAEWSSCQLSAIAPSAKIMGLQISPLC